MTVSTSESVIQYDGNDATVAFPVPFRFLASGDLVVTKTTADGLDHVLVMGTDYSVSGTGALNGGTVTTTTAPASGERLTISREMVPLQETDLRNQGKYLAQTHENAFDYLTMLIQQNAGGLRQAIRVAASDPEPARLPNASSRANLLMGFDGLGNPVPVAPTSGSLNDFALQLANSSDLSKGAALVGRALRTIPTVADLRTVGGHFDGDAVWLVRHYAGGPETGGGLFLWDSASTDADDDGVVISTGLPAGRWVRQIDGARGVSPEFWGASAAGVLDSTAALQAALDYAIPRSLTIFLSPGAYRFEQTLSYSGTGALSIKGHGEKNSALIFYNQTDDGIVYQPSSGGGCDIEGWSLLHSGLSAKTGGGGLLVSCDRPSLKNFSVGSANGTSEWFSYCVRLLKCNESYQENVRYFGQSLGALDRALDIIASDKSVSHEIVGPIIYNAAVGINIETSASPGGEGIRITGGEIVYNLIGIRAYNTSGYTPPLVQIIGTHNNSIDQCLFVKGYQQVTISGCTWYIYRSTASSASTCFVYCDGGITSLHIGYGTTFSQVGVGSGSITGIISAGSLSVLDIIGLYVSGGTGGALAFFSVAPIYVKVIGTSVNFGGWENNRDVFFSGLSPQKIVFCNNYPSVQNDIQVDVAISGSSVNVVGTRASIIRVTGTTGASTITAAVGDNNGRVVEFKSDVAGVTVVHGASFRLKRSTNFVMQAGDTIAMRNNVDGSWEELWRD